VSAWGSNPAERDGPSHALAVTAANQTVIDVNEQTPLNDARWASRGTGRQDIASRLHTVLMSTTRPELALRRHSARPQIILLATALALWSVPALAQAPPERLGDKDVKKLIDEVDTGRDKFEGNLDNTFKNSTLQGPNGEIKVAAALQDYQDNTKKLQSRFTPDYAAGPEVLAVLKQSGSIDAFMKSQPSTMKGRTEWERQVSNLERLAAVYGTAFPLPDGATVHRINDKEPIAAAASIAAAGKRFKSELDKSKTLPKPEKDATKKDAELLIKQADTVKDRISGGEPATGDVRLLVEHVAKIDAFVTAKQLPRTNWQAVQTSLGTLQQAFGLTK
jgi:hypothetical protein